MQAKIGSAQMDKTSLIQRARERAEELRSRGFIYADAASATSLIDRLADALEQSEREKLEEREACAVVGADACECDTCDTLVAAAIRARSVTPADTKEST